ncbi:UvrB/UvrC motif-containing protein, partial [Sphingobacterium shayense]|uniref:UvrB/UvrC motif-containing protein n=1 Tax=Sphingobacterium shayense TaxID=626343 RepID=UPI001557F980
MDAAGIIIESNDFAFLENIENLPKKENTIHKDPKKEKEPKSPYANLTDEQLESTLNKAIESEQYETAAKIRDEIERRKS